MKRLAIFILLLLLAGCATVPANGDIQVTVTAGRLAQCKAGGGCSLVTQAEVMGMLDEAYELGVASVAASLDSQGCRRSS